MKGILFAEILFKKTIKKEKTMTRREHSLKYVNKNPDDFHAFDINEDDSVWMENPDMDMFLAKPSYKAGEVVYIKEPYLHGVLNEDGDTYLVYKYDFTEEEREGYKWKNKLFMGEEYARHYIRITEVRVERLYDISDEDCLKEGIDVDKSPYRGDFFYDYQENDYSFISPQESFFSLFRFANNYPKKKEIPNLWVWVYSYYLCDKSGNKL